MLNVILRSVVTLCVVSPRLRYPVDLLRHRSHFQQNDILMSKIVFLCGKNVFNL